MPLTSITSQFPSLPSLSPSSYIQHQTKLISKQREEKRREREERAMDWHSWLSKSNLNESLSYEYSLVFTQNELEENDIPYLNHEFLQSMGISIAKHRLEILKLAKKTKKITPKALSKFLEAMKKTKKCLSEYLRPLAHCDSSAIVVVPESLDNHKKKMKKKKKKKKLVLANAGVKIIPPPPSSSFSHNSSPISYSSLRKMKDDKAKTLVRWDSMFEDLKPT